MAQNKRHGQQDRPVQSLQHHWSSKCISSSVDSRSMSRCLGLFSYYSQWIPRLSDRIKPIASCKKFPLPPPAVEAFQSLRKTIEDAVVTAVDETIPFEVETDASEVALTATLNQNGRPVAFFSRTLQGSKLKHASIVKEAQAIIETVRHWRHFLTGRHFILKTDQKSVSLTCSTSITEGR